MKQNKKPFAHFKVRLLLLIGGICMTFLAGEGVLRFYRFFRFAHLSEALKIGLPLGEKPNEPDFMRDIPGLFIPDPKVGHRYRPGARVRWREAWYEINAEGWRGPDWPRVAEKDTVILCLGDSITFGYGVPFEEAFCSRLQVILKEKSPHHPPIVLNASSSDFNTDQEVYIFKELLPTWKPDVVIVNFYKNDIYPDSSRVDDQGRLYLLPDPKSLDSPSPFYLFFYSLTRRSLLVKFLERRIGSIISFCILQFPQTASWSQEARSWQETEQKLEELVQLARRSHVRVMFAYFPDYFEIGILGTNSKFYRFGRIAHDLQVPLVDIRKIFEHRPKEQLYVDFVHLNGEGHQLAAQLLVEAIGFENTP